GYSRHVVGGGIEHTSRRPPPCWFLGVHGPLRRRPLLSGAIRPLANGATRMLNFLKSLFGIGSDASLDHDLVAQILDNLKREPSDQLRTMLDPSSVDRWSPEALHAARLLLDERAKGLAPEPVYRTEPRTAQEQAAREQEPVAPRFDRRLLALDVG